MELKDEVIFVDFLFIQYPLSFVTNVACNTFKAIKKILVTNVVCG